MDFSTFVVIIFPVSLCVLGAIGLCVGLYIKWKDDREEAEEEANEAAIANKVGEANLAAEPPQTASK